MVLRIRKSKMGGLPEERTIKLEKVRNKRGRRAISFPTNYLGNEEKGAQREDSNLKPETRELRLF